MTIREFFKLEDNATYHMEFVPENETAFVLKRSKESPVQTALFSFQSATMYEKQLHLVLKEECSDKPQLLHFSVLPFNEYMLLLDPSDADIEMPHDTGLFNSADKWMWIFLMMAAFSNPQNGFGNTMPTEQEQQR